MRFSLKMDCDNAAFTGGDDDYGAGPEIARILRELADGIDDVGFDSGEGTLVDFNGNRVGSWTLGEDMATSSPRRHHDIPGRWT